MVAAGEQSEDSEAGATRDEHTNVPVIVPPPTAPYAVAKEIYEGCRDVDGIRSLLFYRGGWQLWRTTRWSEIDSAEVRSRIYRALANAFYIKDGLEIAPWDPTRHKIANVMDAMAAIGHLSSDVDAPAWVDRHVSMYPAAQMISCTNGLLDVASRTLQPHTAALFNWVGVPFGFDPGAPEPTVWLGFLRSVWPDDPQAITLDACLFALPVIPRLMVGHH